MKAKQSFPLMILVVLLASCTLSSPPDKMETDDSAPPASSLVLEPTIEIPLTDTPLPPPPTDTPTPTMEPTPTIDAMLSMMMTGIPTAPPAFQTTVLQVDVSKLSDYSFEVRPNTDLTLEDIGNDGKSNTCKITKTGFSEPVTIPLSSASLKFRLPAGEYRLICEIPNKFAKIVSK